MRVRERPARPRPGRRGTGRLRRGADLLRGLLATSVLIALVVGTPWGLALYIGWPFPRHLLTLAEIGAVLLAPMSTNFLLHALACILWAVWAAFAVDVARTTADEIRAVPRPTVPHVGPLNAVAAALVGTIILALLSQRPTAAAPPTPHTTRTVTTTAIAPASLSANLVGVSVSVGAPDDRHLRTSRTSGTVEVEPPRAGIYDSLWRIAVRTLGDGSRWPEIYALNRGRPQLDGRSLVNPNLIRPGWILRLPNDSSSSGSYDPGHRKPVGPAPSYPPGTSIPTAPNPSPSSDTSPPPSAHQHSATPAVPSSPAAQSPSLPTRDFHRRPGINLPTGAFVGVGFAAVIAAVLLVVRRRHRVRYRPGNGERDDLTIAPVVRALRLAYDDATRADDEAQPDGTDPPHSRLASSQTPLPTGGNPAAPVLPSRDDRVIGVRDGQELAWNLARTQGLGLTGPGALDAVRALLIALLAESSHPAESPVELLIPASDADRLLGERPGVSTHLHIVDDLDAALDRMEGELLTRTRSGMNVKSATDDVGPPLSDLVLIATPDSRADPRLQAILENGSTIGMVGILLGQWRPGTAARVGPDGTVTAASLHAEGRLIGSRLFTLPTSDARAVLEVLLEAEPEASPTTAPSPPALPEEPKAATVSSPSSPSEVDDAARSVPASSPQPHGAHTAAHGQGPTDPKPLHLVVLGDVRLTHHQGDSHEHSDLSRALTPKQREILAYLALHRGGARREALVADIWPEAPQQRPYNSFHATLSQLRRALRTATQDTVADVTLHEDGRYSLDAPRITVDLWQLMDTLPASRRGTSGYGNETSVERAVDLYTGDFAVDLTAEWTEAPREALRRDVLDAVSALVRMLRDSEPDRALALLERVRRIDTYNEAIYRDIARFQAHLGRHDAVPRTFNLLTTTLASIDEQPSRETRALFAALQRREADEWRSSTEGIA